MITINCDSMAPLQDPLTNALASLAEIAASLKTQANVLYAQAKQALLNGDTALYQTLMNQYGGMLGQYSTYIDTIKSIFAMIAPFPLSVSDSPTGSIDCLTTTLKQKGRAIVTEFSSFLIQKFLDIISTVLPLSFNVPVPFFGSVDIVRLFTDTAYVQSLKTQIVDNLSAVVSAIPSAIAQQYNGLLSVLSTEYLAQEIWQWFMQQIATGGTQLLHQALGGLIDKFKTIWDTFGFPSLPSLLTLDIESIILSVVDSVKSQYESTIVQPLQSAYDTIKAAFAEGNADDDQLRSAGEQLKEAVKNKWKAIIDAVLGIGVFGVTIGDMVNLSTSSATLSSEDILVTLISQAKDWAMKFPLKILTDWMNVVKDFLSAIGLSPIIEFLTFNFCKFLEFIGFPLN